MEFDFSSGIENIDPWEIHIPYSRFSQAPCHTPNDYFASLTYAKEYEKQMNNRQEMTEKIINGLTTGAYVLTSCTHINGGFGQPAKIDASFVLPLFYRTPTAKSKTMPIKKVVFNDPATIVFWGDGDKTVVKCGENDIFDPEKGLALAIFKKFLGNKGKYYDIFKKWLPEEKEECESPITSLAKAVDRITEAFSKVGQALNNQEKEEQPTIYTRDEATTISEIFEDILYKYGIRIPSEDDHDRSEEDVDLYGTEYSDLLDRVEDFLCGLLEYYAPNVKTVRGVYSGQTENKEHISVTEAAERLGVSASTVRKWYARGKLKGFKNINRIWIDANDPAFNK